VLINRGNGFQRVASSTQANAGDLIMASPGGSAKVVYPGGCVVNVKPGAVITVRDQSPCGQAMRLEGDCRQAGPCPTGFISELGPFAIGAGGALTGFLISTNQHEGQHEGRDDPASP
jgi:hypothetical protein